MENHNISIEKLEQNVKKLLPDLYDKKCITTKMILAPTGFQIKDILQFHKRFDTLEINQIISFAEFANMSIVNSIKYLANDEKFENSREYQEIIEKVKYFLNSEIFKVPFESLLTLSKLYNVSFAKVLLDLNQLTPKNLYKYLDLYVVGQHNAKMAYSTVFFNHFLKNGFINIEFDPDYLNSNNLICIGPSGSGKTLNAKLLAKTCHFPITIMNCASITNPGYTGDDLTNCFTNLMIACNQNIKKAQTGIVILDEFDKLRSSNDEIGTTSVQQEFLSIIEGNHVNVKTTHERYADRINFDTKNITFIMIGAFIGLENIIKKRLGGNIIGFTNKNLEVNNLLSYLTTSDLIDYGYLPELIGRISKLCILDSLTKDNLFDVLTKSKDNALQNITNYFKTFNCDVVFKEDGLKLICEIAEKRQLGARWLKSALDIVLEDEMFEVPSNTEQKSIEITKSIVELKLKMSF